MAEIFFLVGIGALKGTRDPYFLSKIEQKNDRNLIYIHFREKTFSIFVTILENYIFIEKYYYYFFFFFLYKY